MQSSVCKKVRKNKGNQLSGGERRRTEIARCLAIDPKFIMLDEPFAGVDPIAVEDIQQIVWKLKDRNIGILITDHNVQETLSITDRAYLLFEGKILFQGTPEELAENKIVREKYLSNSFCASPQGLYGVEPVFAAAYNNKPITIKKDRPRRSFLFSPLIYMISISEVLLLLPPSGDRRIRRRPVRR